MRNLFCLSFVFEFDINIIKKVSVKLTIIAPVLAGEIYVSLLY